MPKFTYSARNQAGKRVAGTLTAANLNEAAEDLKRQNLHPLQIEPVGGGVGPRSARRAKVKMADMLVFTRQLATMLSAGIPLLETLEILTDQAEDPGFKAAIGDIAENVRSGNDFSESLRRYPRIFDNIYINMIRAGEASGQLDEILDRLAEYQEAAYRLRLKVRSAMMYPAISMTMIAGISLFLLIFIVPRFQEIFTTLNVDLPTPTLILMVVGNWLQNNFLWWVLGVIAFWISLRMYKKTPTGRRQWDWLALKVPVFGALNLKVALSRFSRTFSTLIESGVPILGALEIVAATTGNALLEDVVLDAMESVRQGETLATPLETSGVFPPMVTRMIAIGEKSGALELLLRKISAFYDQQIEATIENLTSLIEPLLIGVMGFIVGGMVAAIFMPMFELIGKLA